MLKITGNQEPEAGAICFLKYKADIPSVELFERILKNKNTLIVPGSYLGMEGYIRIWLGCSDEAKWCEGLKRIKEEIKAIM
jgi:aspartate/methionine/tyrosine aminotransferase